MIYVKVALGLMQSLVGHADLGAPEGQQKLAFYFLAASPSTMAEGLKLIDRLPSDRRFLPAGWAVQALCWRALRRPEQAAGIEEHRTKLKAALVERGIDWRPGTLPTGLHCGY